MRLDESGELEKVIEESRFPHNYYMSAAAAAIVAAIALLFFYVRESPQRPMLAASAATLVDRSGASPAVTASHVLLRTRGAESDIDIIVADPPQAIELRVLPEVFAQPRRYRVELSAVAVGSEPQTLAAVGDLVPDEDTFVSVYLDASRLAAGMYILTIAGEAGTSAAKARSKFSINLKRPSPPPN